MSSDDSIRKIKKLHEELTEMEQRMGIYVQGDEYVPSGSAEVSFSVEYECIGNPFASLPYIRTSGARKMREELLEPKNI